MYAIIDIETTGLNSVSDKITEIAIFIHDGNKIVDEFISLGKLDNHIRRDNNNRDVHQIIRSYLKCHKIEVIKEVTFLV